jgi:hypothetical protein
MPQRPSRKDFLLLPLISFFTALFMLGGAELVSAHFFQEAQQGNCSVPDRFLPYRYKPNCSYTNKAAEGPMVRYVFNDCGYRSKKACRPKPAGALRIALLGASTAEGFKVAYQDGLAPRVEAGLTQSCRRPVEIQNLGVAGFGPLHNYIRLEEALALNPDVVMFVITPYELADPIDPVMFENRHRAYPLKRGGEHDQPRGANQAEWLAQASALLSNSRAALAAQYFLFQDRQKYIKLFLMHGDKADYLRVPFSEAWLHRFKTLDILLGEMADRIHAQGLPFVLVLTPQRIQAALSDPAGRPPGVDPDALGRRIGEIAKAHNIDFVDTYDAFRQQPESEKLFYPVDGHMTPDGHKVVADATIKALEVSGGPFHDQCLGVAAR